MSARLKKSGHIIEERYKLIDEIGAGGYGIVWQARDLVNSRDVAIKFLKYDFNLERFHQEAQILKRLEDAHCQFSCQIFDYVTTIPEEPFIVMELLEGRTLKDELGKSFLPIQRIKDVFSQILDATAEFHQNGIVHRDLKPGNIFITSDDEIKILDFGISKSVDEEYNQLTRTGDTFGTPDYMAPEQFENATKVEEHADIWAIGVMLYQALTGCKPFSDTSSSSADAQANREEIKNNVLLVHYTSLGSVGINNDITRNRNIESIVDLALERTPIDRFSNATGGAAARIMKERLNTAIDLIPAIVSDDTGITEVRRSTPAPPMLGRGSIGKRILHFLRRNSSFFKPSSFSALRELIVSLVLFVIGILLFPTPELIDNVVSHHGEYQQKLRETQKLWDNWQEKHNSADRTFSEEIAKTWFSKRGFDYRKLNYFLFVSGNEKVDSEEWFVALAKWQYGVLDLEVDSEQYTLLQRAKLFYLVNPGFYSDIGFLLPWTFMTLLMGIYVLFSYLLSSEDRSLSEFRPSVNSSKILDIFFNPAFALAVFIGALTVTAGNYIYASEFQTYLSLCAMSVVLFILSAILGILFIKNAGIGEYQKNMVPKWFNYLLAIALLVSVVILISTLVARYPWTEGISGFTLSWTKIPQRLFRYFITAHGLYLAIWTVTFTLVYARKHIHAPTANIDDMVASFESVAEKEIKILDYFSAFAVLVPFSYLQSAIAVQKNASENVGAGIVITAGIIVVFLFVLIPPISYISYIIFDLRRFDKWAKLTRETLKNKREQLKIERHQKSRLKKLLKIVFFRNETVFIPLLLIVVLIIWGSALTGII